MTLFDEAKLTEEEQEAAWGTPFEDPSDALAAAATAKALRVMRDRVRPMAVRGPYQRVCRLCDAEWKAGGAQLHDPDCPLWEAPDA